MKPKIFVFVNGGQPGLLDVVAIAEDGCYLAGHACSSEYYIPWDMGFKGTHQHSKYDAHYPNGWELEFVKKPKKHEGLMKAYALNQVSATTPST